MCCDLPGMSAVLLLLVDMVLADYCEFGWCEDEKQYCCGKNICCDKTLDLRLFWAGVLLVIFLLAVIAIIRKLRKVGDYKLLSQNEVES